MIKKLLSYKVKNTDPMVLTASQINKEMEALRKIDSMICNEFIRMGQGSIKISEIRKMNTPLAKLLGEVLDREHALKTEKILRYGSDINYLPTKGFGPRKRNGAIIYARSD